MFLPVGDSFHPLFPIHRNHCHYALPSPAPALAKARRSGAEKESGVPVIHVSVEASPNAQDKTRMKTRHVELPRSATSYPALSYTLAKFLLKRKYAVAYVSGAHPRPGPCRRAVTIVRFQPAFGFPTPVRRHCRRREKRKVKSVKRGAGAPSPSFSLLTCGAMRRSGVCQKNKLPPTLRRLEYYPIMAGACQFARGREESNGLSARIPRVMSGVARALARPRTGAATSTLRTARGAVPTSRHPGARLGVGELPTRTSKGSGERRASQRCSRRCIAVRRADVSSSRPERWLKACAR